jgi:hypothetical protein
MCNCKENEIIKLKVDSKNVIHNHHIFYAPEIIIKLTCSEHIKNHNKQARELAKEMKFSFREAQTRLRLERLGSMPTIRRIYNF